MGKPIIEKRCPLRRENHNGDHSHHDICMQLFQIQLPVIEYDIRTVNAKHSDLSTTNLSHQWSKQVLNIPAQETHNDGVGFSA
jgi:hypothetical protein